MSQALHGAKRIVIKVGSALISRDGAPRTRWIESLAADIAALCEAGKDVLLVSSGAIALGRSTLGPDRPRKLEEKQAAAAFGQPRLIQALEAAFAPHSLPVAQSLITLDDTETRRRWLNARATLETILTAGGLPVINENDTVATDEIRYGDNDRLAARVAQMMKADVLVLLSDVDGLYTADPRTHPSARHLPHIEDLTADHEAMAGAANAEADVGSGGMATKLAAAKIAIVAGCATIIADGRGDHPLAALQAGARHTLISSRLTPAAARVQWLASNLKPEGQITVDSGAAKAIREGASLLPVGVTGIFGSFERGAAVEIAHPQGSVIAKGVTAYSARDILAIKGLQSDAVRETLGYRGRPAVVHRDDIVLAGPHDR
ncbi:MAG: glutamate 5-kinase [Pseudomonadota bacterium]